MTPYWNKISGALAMLTLGAGWNLSPAAALADDDARDFQPHTQETVLPLHAAGTPAVRTRTPVAQQYSINFIPVTRPLQKS